MYKCNFKDMIEVSELLSNDNALSGRKKKMKDIGIFAQCLDNQLWDGHPYIFPNFRLLLESFCDLILEEDLRINVKYDSDNGISIDEFKTILQEDLRLVRGGGQSNKIIEMLPNKQLVLRSKYDYTFYIKHTIIECVFDELGYRSKDWGFHFLRDQTNERTHKIYLLERDKTYTLKQYYDVIFDIMKLFHDGIYKFYMENLVSDSCGIVIEKYQKPDQNELESIIREYIQKLEYSGVSETVKLE